MSQQVRYIRSARFCRLILGIGCGLWLGLTQTWIGGADRELRGWQQPPPSANSLNSKSETGFPRNDRALAPVADRNLWPADVVAATCHAQVIRARPLDQQILLLVEDQSLQRELSPLARDQARAALLAQAIDQQLIVQALAGLGNQAGPNEVQWEYDQLREQLDREGSTIADYLQKWQITDDELRRELAWRIVWRRDGENHLTEKRLQELFLRRQPEFDGTERVVSQILFTTEQQTLAEALATAQAVKQKLLAGQLAWAEAVAQYSSGPSRHQQGRLGAIRFHEPMPAEFSQAAFELAVQEISDPVVTAFGVHLIRIDEIKPGKFQLGDVRERVVSAARQERFEQLAQPLRHSDSVKYTGLYPYFDAQGKLVLPK
jgi:parvulin-like peptidyl-prolyl isomerase